MVCVRCRNSVTSSYDKVVGKGIRKIRDKHIFICIIFLIKVLDERKKGNSCCILLRLLESALHNILSQLVPETLTPTKTYSEMMNSVKDYLKISQSDAAKCCIAVMLIEPVRGNLALVL